MRLLLKLKALGNFSYDTLYYSKLHGLIYNTIKPHYPELHNKSGYKFFCFSNIFPIGDFKENDIRSLLISSPDKFFIKTLIENLPEGINIGEMSFNIESRKLITPFLNKNSSIISATPIVIRIPEYMYDTYKIPEKYRKKRYVYWRPCYSFEAFVKQLEDNLIKKYNEFYKTDIEIERIFEMFKFLKPVVNHIMIDGKEQVSVGSLWEFTFSYIGKKQRKLLEFGIDCGFGERNSFGFGFMNIKFDKH